MLPNSFSTSFRSASTTSGSTAPFNPLSQPAAPGPDLLQIASTGSTPTFDTSGLQPSGFGDLLTQPHFLQWLTQITGSPGEFSFTAGSSSSSSSSSAAAQPPRKTRKFEATHEKPRHETDLTPDPKRVKTTSGLSTPPPSPRQMEPFAEALTYLSDSALMKTRQQLRDEEFNQTIKPLLPTVLAAIVRSYVGSELSLSPLERDKDGVPEYSASNERITRHIFSEFGENYPGSVLFQNEITETHYRTTLDPVFAGKATANYCPNLLKRILSGDSIAQQQRRQDLRSVVNYLPFSRCEQLLIEEMTNPSHDHPDRDELSALKSVNSGLLIAALEKKRHSPETEIIRRRDLQFNRGKALQNYATIQLKAGPQNAHIYFLQALKIFCSLNKKREAVEIVIQLIEQIGKIPGTGFDDIVKLFLAAKTLCLCYPAADDLYAKLVFAMDVPCCRRSEFALSKKLYDEAEASHLQLSCRYQAKFYYRHIIADQRAGLSSLAAMHRVNSALQYCLSELNISHQISISDDLRRADFLRSVALLFRLAAELTERHAMSVEQWSDQQYAESLSLIKHVDPKEIPNPFPFPRDHQAKLKFHGTGLYAACKSRLLSASAEYYKNAVKILRDFEYVQEPETRHLLMLVFDGLVELYRKYRNVEALGLLLRKKTLADFHNTSEFQSRLPVWNETLRQLNSGTVED